MPITFHHEPCSMVFEIRKNDDLLVVGGRVQRPGAKVSEWAVMVVANMPPEDLGCFPDVQTARRAAVKALKARGVRP